MKRLFNTNFNHGSLHFMLLVLRISIASFMIVHGYQKLGWLTAGGEIQFGDPIGVGAAASLYLAVFAEFFCSIFLLIGLGTRLATIPLIITMLIAVFIVHAPDGFDKKEMGLHYLLVYVFLLVSGPGKYSIDHIISKNLYSRRR
ncbi:MAG: DoxX family protein [Candidatus Pedobacter colombiensis]|uniref:DoxX family protein n=1 Tax=Candidatus Pedobacter colombiensis TaxID=3121371 RepID=A0AAJ6B9T9_9SPHI|nr:DoxX family protein [Pedobacter sp.]WEK20553.1 MAG: DoxX family protein [Pedobacter sp.]